MHSKWDVARFTISTTFVMFYISSINQFTSSTILQAFVVEKYNRPMPKLRNTKPESGSYEERSVPPGTLNVAQLRHIMLLYQGKADDHHGPMDINQIAEKFRLEVTQVKTILQSLSLPPEDDTKQKRNNQ